ncbi:Zinc finger, PMZ-type [Corchorus olitorius]|uniref:Zinc finger, PMZ-type n=1 Tax=Corchorus olitorius TaxID=93759 RepID=A0A1R3K8J0_9ROSI|nr:Zinc finger, PMZ-type [Corchorus olitorius]
MNKLMGIVKAGSEPEWQARVDALIAKNEHVGKELMLEDKNPRAWTRAFFGEHAKCDMVDNNICESFNSILLDARRKNIITMLEEIREQTMRRIEAKRNFCTKWKQDYGPLIKKKFDARKKDARQWKMVSYGSNGAEVKQGNKSYIVKLDRTTCSCRYWQISGMPCCHAISAIWKTGGDPNKFLDPCYSKETYLRAYQYSLHPINGSHEWRKLDREKLLPPLTERQKPGRPKHNRRKGPEDKNLCPGTGRKGTIITCGNCHAQGHNKRGCKNPPKARVGKKQNQATKGPTQATASSKGPANSTAPAKGPAQATAPTKGPAQATAPTKGPPRRVSKATSTQTALPDIKIRENIAVSKAQSQPMQSAAADKAKGIKKMDQPEVRFKKKSTKGMGLYPNKDGTSTFYNAFDFGNSSRGAVVGTKRGKTSNADPVGTQESVKKQK